ncbi:hypothetical protein [Quadrisphaera sp. INWT6]|uniref:hypothetical protein n=1 Tax=Quadrisphaera sp. INWT6 TaxID=2596917 RepID=UPI0018924234|nr:hypothetical protein [Quadrisphaera sp. INWT6]
MSGEGAGDDRGDDLGDDLDVDVDLDQEPDEEPGRPGRPGLRADRAAQTAGAAGRSRRRRVGVVAAVAAVLTAATLGVGSLAGRAADQHRPLFAGPASPEELFPVLAQEASPGSGYSGTTLVSSLGVDPSTPRRIASTSTADFWVARTGDGRICLLARDTRDADGLGGTCGSVAEAAAGLRLPAGEGVSSVLLPPAAADGSDSADALVEEGYERVGDSLWVDGDTARRTAEDLVDAASDRSVVVASDAREGSSALPVFLTQRDVTHAVVLACLQAAQLEVAVARGAPQPVGCGQDAAFVRFEGTGGPVRVTVTAPEGLLWAAGVVRCSSSLQGPVC